MTQRTKTFLGNTTKVITLIIAVAGSATAGVNIGARMLESAVIEPKIAPVHRLAADSLDKSTRALEAIEKLHEKGTTSSRERLNIEEREVLSLKSEMSELKHDMRVIKDSTIQTETDVRWIRTALEKR